MVKLVDIIPVTKTKGGAPNRVKKKPLAKPISILSLVAPRQLLLEGVGAQHLEEATWRPWDNKFDVRLDRRPDRKRPV